MKWALALAIVLSSCCVGVQAQGACTVRLNCTACLVTTGCAWCDNNVLPSYCIPDTSGSARPCDQSGDTAYLTQSSCPATPSGSPTLLAIVIAVPVVVGAFLIAVALAVFFYCAFRRRHVAKAPDVVLAPTTAASSPTTIVINNNNNNNNNNNMMMA